MYFTYNFSCILFPAFQKIVWFKVTKLAKAVEDLTQSLDRQTLAADLETPDVTYVEEIKNGPISSVEMYHTYLTSKYRHKTFWYAIIHPLKLIKSYKTRTCYIYCICCFF